MQSTPPRVKDFPAIALLTLSLLTVSLRLYATNWTPGLEVVLSFTLLGLALGLTLGASRYPGWLGGMFVLGYSLAFFPLLLGSSQYPAGFPWLDRLTGLGGRLAISWNQLFTGQDVKDPLLFIGFMSLLFWVISLGAGFGLVRSGSLAGAILPAGLVLAIIQFYDMQVGNRVFILAIYLFLSLLLLGRVTYLRRRAVWKKQRVLTPAETGVDLNLVFSLAALLLVVLAWIAPASGRPIVAVRVFWEDLTRPWQAFTKQLDHSVASLQNHQVQAVLIYGDTLALGRQAQSGTSPYLRIHTPIVGGASRYYWRVRSYDEYQNGTWTSGDTFDEPFTPDQSPLVLPDPGGLSGAFTFSAPRANLAQLVTPARPIWISRPASLSFLPAASGRIDPLAFYPAPPVMSGEEYTVHANILEPTIAELSAAGTDYPNWVTAHYLELPADLPPVIGSLARQITLGAANPYDQAQAVTEFLRANITYSTSVPAIPAGEDPLVWFLFQGRTGFCNYYATAEVVLLRSLGIPARMVVGFAQGEFQVPNLYVVRQQDAHAWPEVYFPGIGWEEFEPTTSQPPLIREAGTNPASTGVVNPTPQPTSEAGQGRFTPTPASEGTPASSSGSSHTSVVYLTAIFLLALAFLVGIGLTLMLGGANKLRASGQALPSLLVRVLERLSLRVPVWLRRWASLSGLSAAQRSFAVVYRCLRWLGAEVPISQTPAEAAASLTRLLPQSGAAIAALLEECQRSLYSQSAPDAQRARRSAQLVRKAALRAAIRRRWQAFGGIFSGRFG